MRPIGLVALTGIATAFISACRWLHRCIIGHHEFGCRRLWIVLAWDDAHHGWWSDHWFDWLGDFRPMADDVTGRRRRARDA